MFWLRADHELIAGEPASLIARLPGLVDISNGITPRVSPERAAFPNLDLTAHLFREPRSAWIGFDSSVSYGPTGIGLTHSILHDEDGPVGTAQQSLTVRPRV